MVRNDRPLFPVLEKVMEAVAAVVCLPPMAQLREEFGCAVGCVRPVPEDPGKASKQGDGEFHGCLLAAVWRQMEWMTSCALCNECPVGRCTYPKVPSRIWPAVPTAWVVAAGARACYDALGSAVREQLHGAENGSLDRFAFFPLKATIMALQALEAGIYRLFRGLCGKRRQGAAFAIPRPSPVSIVAWAIQSC